MKVVIGDETLCIVPMLYTHDGAVNISWLVRICHRVSLTGVRQAHICSSARWCLMQSMIKSCIIKSGIKVLYHTQHHVPDKDFHGSAAQDQEVGNVQPQIFYGVSQQFEIFASESQTQGT